MSAARQFFDAIDQTKRGRPPRPPFPGGDSDGSEARLATAMPLAAALRQHVGTAIIGVHEHHNGILLELAPRGHMSRRWVLVEGVTGVTDITFDRATDTRAEDEQAQIDIGDDKYERERYEDRE